MEIIIIIAILTILFAVFKNRKNAIFCKNNENLNQLYANCKYEYYKLSFSDLSHKLSKALNQKQKTIFCMHEIVKNKNYYMSLAKTIDYKINTNKNKYKAKNHKVFIEAIAEISVYDFKSTNKSTIFASYKQLYSEYKILQKEHRVFKMLVGKLLLEELCSLCNEINQISRVIEKSSMSKKIILYKNMLFVQAEAYAFYLFNPNGKKLLNNLSQRKEINIEFLFNELEFYNKKIKKICCYLKCMFN